MPNRFNFQQIDDFFFQVLAGLYLFLGGLAEINGPAQDPRLQMDMAAETDVVQHGHSFEQFDFLEGPGKPQPARLWGGSLLISCP